MQYLAWKDSMERKLKHEKDLFDQYVAYKKSNGRLKPKLVVGKKYRSTYPELYDATNPKAKEWNPNPNHIKSKEFVPPNRSKEEK